MFPELPNLYWYLALARIILVLIPQLGYIHPDEFFQTLEIEAGHAFDIESNPPWEFNASFPIRSMAIPYFTVGVTYRLANVLNHFTRLYFATSIITPYFLVVGPRLLFCCLSFLVDFTLYQVCVNNNEKYRNKLVILASSYVMIVYGTRTFSNTVELILFALLQYYVCDSLIFSNTLIKKREYLNYRYETSRTVVEKVRFHKLKLFLKSDSLRNCFQISTITVLGFFNRPTFLAFALFPVFFWLYRGLGNKFVAPLNYHLRILALIICSIPALFVNIVIDSFYYGYLTWGEIGVLHITIDNLIFTPLNFIKYNTDSSNLAKHGLHPRILHVLVNAPLLFNILAIFAMYGFLQAAYNFIRGKHQMLPTVRSIKGLMTLSYIAPLALLSIFPHQEPRFLIPLIIPLVYLYSSALYPESDNIIIRLDSTTKKKQNPVAKTPDYFLKLWLLLNVILGIFYGFLHQGGVYQVANHLSKEMRFQSPRSDYYIVSSHIYSLPECLFLQPSSSKLRYSKSSKYITSKRYFLYEQGSSSLDILKKDINKIRARINPNKRHKLLLIIPSSLENQLNYNNTQLRFKKINTFYPHISVEAIPELITDLSYFYASFKLQDFYISVVYIIRQLFSSFGLDLYEVYQR